MEKEISVGYAVMNNLESWMRLIDVVRRTFPGLGSQEEIDEYKNTVEKNIARKSAICAVTDNEVVGFLLFSTKYNMLCHMAVHPDYRRKKVASRMIELMLNDLDKTQDIVVLTFRADDEKGDAPRALYKSFGFEADELCYNMNYPEQKFILRANHNSPDLT
ncbi:MAG: GNAT family N-acetyltransferase [Candidatus Bathyarchaeota archaeon]|nr:GNAT family N-acetyltransferase [Candidatus Bathyarchaeota archaeon]